MLQCGALQIETNRLFKREIGPVEDRIVTAWLLHQSASRTYPLLAANKRTA
jgi:hypothetical protein